MSGFLKQFKKDDGSINYLNIVLCTIVVIGLMAIGFFAGRKTIEPETIEKIEFRTLPAIHDTIRTPVPYVIKPAIDTEDIIISCVLSGKYYDLFPEKIKDSIIYVTKNDTTKIMREWACTRKYAENLFDIDTIGKCDVTVDVQYNEIQTIGYEFTPIQKVSDKTVITQRKFEPFIGGGMTTQTAIAQGGMFFEEKYGISFVYQRDYINKKNLYGGVVLFKF